MLRGHQYNVPEISVSARSKVQSKTNIFPFADLQFYIQLADLLEKPLPHFRYKTIIGKKDYFEKCMIIWFTSHKTINSFFQNHPFRKVFFFFYSSFLQIILALNLQWPTSSDDLSLLCYSSCIRPSDRQLWLILARDGSMAVGNRVEEPWPRQKQFVK